MNNRKIARKGIINILLTFSSQFVSLILSLVMTIIIPKMLGVSEFGYWQLYLFYTGYIGLFHFGLIDGINLRNGGLSYHSLDKPVLKSQLVVLIMVQMLISTIIITVGSILVGNDNRLNILLYTGICLVITNTEMFFLYVLQATNKIKQYAISVVVEKIVMLLLIVGLIYFQSNHFELYILANIVSKVLGLLIGAYFCRDLIMGKMSDLKATIKELLENVNSGSKLLLSNISSMLILGNGRFFIDKLWGIQVFGKVSFSFTLSNMILLFINSISIVLFPILRRVPKEKLTEIYSVLRTGLMMLLTGALIIYIPAKEVVSIWLPNYAESLKYMALIFPLVIFDGKMQMLISTNFKVIRKEGMLLKVNVISVIGSIILCGFSAYVVNSVNAVIVSMVIIVIFRSVIAEIYLSREINISITKNLIREILLVIIFMLSSWYIDGIISMLIYAGAYLVFLYSNRKDVRKVLKVIKKVFSRESEGGKEE
ncbi:oligosaccharide flippase family protein [Bacillus wiedmannii]|uniref:oligosaccharide flippase family protein n=1 Tax=Bacillus wiedmannii TaxID=1890302 RepID=UPI0015D50A28|nr:oligosaccharide flippase family protein [Bacillus wiedmannii]